MSKHMCVCVPFSGTHPLPIFFRLAESERYVDDYHKHRKIFMEQMLKIFFVLHLIVLVLFGGDGTDDFYLEGGNGRSDNKKEQQREAATTNPAR